MKKLILKNKKIKWIKMCERVRLSGKPRDYSKRSVRFEFEILCHCNTPREREHNLTDFPFILVKYEIICNVKTVVDESAKSHKSSFQ